MCFTLGHKSLHVTIRISPSSSCLPHPVDRLVIVRWLYCRQDCRRRQVITPSPYVPPMLRRRPLSQPHPPTSSSSPLALLVVQCRRPTRRATPGRQRLPLVAPSPFGAKAPVLCTRPLSMPSPQNLLYRTVLSARPPSPTPHTDDWAHADAPTPAPRTHRRPATSVSAAVAPKPRSAPLPAV